MAKVTAYELVAKFSGDTTGLERSLMRARSALTAFGSIFGLKATAGVAFGKSIINAIDAIANSANKLQISTQAYQAYKYAADLAGQSIEDFVKNGSVGLQQAQDEALRLGIIFDDALVIKAQAAKDSMITLGAVIKRNFQAGLISGFVDEFSTFNNMAANPQVAGNIRNIGSAIGFMAGVAINAANGVGIVIGQISKLNGMVQKNYQTQMLKIAPKSVTEYKNQWDKEAKILADFRAKQASMNATPVFKTSGGGGGRSSSGGGRGSIKQASRDMREYNTESRDALNLIRDMQREQEAYNNSVADTFISFKDGVQQGKSAMESFRSVALNVINDVLNNMIKLNFGGTSGGGLAGTIASSLFGIFSSGSSYNPAKAPPPRKPFAKGGVISGATVFPIGGNHGVMGEKGAEAIMPLVRGANGKLGVQSNGGGGSTVVQNINISTGVQQTVRAEIQRLLPSIQQAATGNTQDAAQRNKVAF